MTGIFLLVEGVVVQAAWRGAIARSAAAEAGRVVWSCSSFFCPVRLSVSVFFFASSRTSISVDCWNHAPALDPQVSNSEDDWESQREKKQNTHTHKYNSLVEFQLAANEFRLYFQLACCSPTLHSRSKLQVMWRLLRIAISSYYCREWEAYEAWRLFWIKLLIKTLRDAAKYKHARGLRMLRARDFPEFDPYWLVAGEWTEFLWQALYHESASVLASLLLSIQTWICVRVRRHKFYCYSTHISQKWKTLDFCCEYDL